MPTEPSEVSCPGSLAIEWLAEPGGTPLSPGDPVELAHGPQGGWHVALTAGIEGAAADSVFADAFVRVASTGEQLAGEDNAFTLALLGWSGSSCAGTMVGMVAYLDDPPDIDQGRICELVGEELIVGLAVAPREGEAPHDVAEVTVVATRDPGDACP